MSTKTIKVRTNTGDTFSERDVPQSEIMAVGAPVLSQSSATYSFAASDVGCYTRFTHATPTVTVEADLTVPMPADAEIKFEAAGGTVTVAAAVGVTVNSAGAKLASSARYVVLTLKRTALNVWTLSGSLA